MSEGDSQKARAVSVVGVALLSLLFGAFAAHFGTFPYTAGLGQGFEALEAYAEKWRSRSATPSNSQHWVPATSTETGVVVHEPAETWGDYTFYTSFHAPVACLIDMDGEVVHEWRLPYSEAFPDPEHVARPVPDANIRFVSSHLFANGDLLVGYKAEGDTPYGYGMVRMDADSEVIWRYAGHPHHDVDVAEDGTIHVLTHGWRNLKERPLEGIQLGPTRVLDDFVVRLSADGTEEDRWSLMEAIARSPMSHTLRSWFRTPLTWDRLHANAVDVVGADFADHHAFAEPGDVLVSLRSLNAVGLLRPATGRVVWMTRGPWLEQHDPDALANGNMLVFDNHGHPGPGGSSRILEFDPTDGRVVWEFAGSREARFDSSWRGMQERLPNGNTLVVESVGGRLLEVTPAGGVVWSYRNPALAEEAGQTWVPHIPGPVQRVERGWLEFDVGGGR